MCAGELSPTSFPFTFLPFVTDRGSLAEAASPSRCPSPCPQPLAVSRCSPVLPGGRPPPNSPSRAAGHVDVAFPVTQLLAPSPRLAITVASLGFHRDATKGRGNGLARPEALFDWWIAELHLFLPSSSLSPVLRPSRWVQEADWLAPWRELLVPAQTSSAGRGRRWAPCALIGWRGASGREGRGGSGSAVSLARRSSPREVLCGVSRSGSRSSRWSSRRAGEP